MIISRACTQRVSNGMQCAREFGKNFALEHRRLPTRQEILDHVEGEKFSRLHCSNMYDEAIWIAKKTLESLYEMDRARLQKSKEANESLFRFMGFTLSIRFESSTEPELSKWILVCSSGFFHRKGIAAHPAFTSYYSGDSIDSILKALSEDVEAWEAKQQEQEQRQEKLSA